MNKSWKELQYENCEFNFDNFVDFIFSWENDLRIIEFSFKEYKKWLYAIKRYTLRQNRPGEDLLFINAWNEWAEGNYLEPDLKWGHAYGEALKKAIIG